MALVRCPECGRQNVSDSAVACPECGFAIREHFERIKAEEERKTKAELISRLCKCLIRVRDQKKEEARRKQIYQQKIEAEEKLRRIESSREDAIVELNEKTDRFKNYMVFFSILLIPLIGLLLFTRFSIGSVILLAVDIFLVYRYKSKIDENKKSLQLSESNRAQFDKNLEEERLKIEAIEKSKQKEREIERERRKKIDDAQHPACPNCGSHNTHRISTAGKIVSTELFGLASSTIGKQYKCDDCKHMW